MSVDRRELLVLLGAGATAAQLEAWQHAHQQLRGAPAEGILTSDELKTVDVLSEMILPADERSPGAREAKVPRYIDLVLANSPAQTQQEFRRNLKEFDKAAGGSFAELTESDRIAFLKRVAAGEAHPASAAEKFFSTVKRMTVFAYYTSEVGVRQELRSKSPEALSEFVGCTHPKGTHV